MQFELNNFMLFIKCLKQPESEAFPITSYVTFCSSSTQSSSTLRLKHSLSRTNKIGHFYFNQLPRIWNALPPIDTNQSIPAIKKFLSKLFWNYFIQHFNPDSPCTFHFLFPCGKCLYMYSNQICFLYVTMYVPSGH